MDIALEVTQSLAQVSEYGAESQLYHGFLRFFFLAIKRAHLLSKP